MAASWSACVPATWSAARCTPIGGRAIGSRGASSCGPTSTRRRKRRAATLTSITNSIKYGYDGRILPSNSWLINITHSAMCVMATTTEYYQVMCSAIIRTLSRLPFTTNIDAVSVCVCRCQCLSTTTTIITATATTNITTVANYKYLAPSPASISHEYQRYCCNYDVTSASASA